MSIETSQSARERREQSTTTQPRFGRLDLAMERVSEGIGKATAWLMGQQHEEGYWCGELEADSMLEADYIYMHTLLGTGDKGRMERAVNEILRHQNEDGGWSLYPGGPSECELRGEVLPGAEADGLDGRTSGDGEGAEEGAGAGRRDGVQHVHEDVPVLAGTVRLRRGAGGSSGDAAVSELVLLQYLRDQRVVAGDPGAAVDYLCEEAVQEAGSGADD